MKILYTIAGEGLGHATRSEAAINHLKKKHEVVIVTDNRAFNYFYKPDVKVHKITTAHIFYRHNALNMMGSIFINLLSMPKQIVSFFTLAKILKSYKPDLIINDFTYQVSYLSKLFHIPMVTLDNQHILTKGNISVSDRWSCFLARLGVHISVPSAQHHFITTFFYPKTKKKTTLVGPVLRKKILSKKPKEGKHILVYQTSQSNDELFEVLPRLTGYQFLVYGFGKRKSGYKHIIFKDYNEDSFLDDFASCQAVIANGGFSLLSEAIFLGKPVLSLPVHKQFEQMLNAYYLDKIGYGKNSRYFSEEVFISFMKNLFKYKRKLKKFDKRKVNDVFGHLDNVLKKLRG